jgi:uncharacterized membrane protein YfcA
MPLALAIVLAVLVGGMLGALGGGGSILTLPILKYLLDMQAHQAIATSLFVVGATSLAALTPYARRGRVHWRIGAIFGLASMLGAYLAGRVARHIPAAVLLIAFAAMMLATALAMLRGRRVPDRGAAPDREPPGLPIAKLLVEGAIVGAVTGLVGAGGGADRVRHGRICADRRAEPRARARRGRAAGKGMKPC